MTDFPTKLVMPTWRLTEKQFRYVPSWLHSTPVRYTLPKLNGKYGLMKPTVPEGTAYANDHTHQAEPHPGTAG